MFNIISKEQLEKYLQHLETGKVPVHKAKRKLTSVLKFVDFVQKKDGQDNTEEFKELIKFIEEKTPFRITNSEKSSSIKLSYKNPLLYGLKDILNRPFRLNKNVTGNKVKQPPQEIPLRRDDNPLSAIRYPQSISFSSQQLIGAGLLGLFLIAFGIGLYNQFIKNAKNPFAYSTAPILGGNTGNNAGRVLSFQGRLTDSLGNPITSAVSVEYNFYTAGSGGTSLATRTCTNVQPDQDGVFNSLIGQDTGCSTQIPASVFTENPMVYLGVKVGSDPEMTPRQQIANVGYAITSETLQGLPPGTATSNVPFINSQGDILVGAAAPGIRNTYASATFAITSASAVTVQSAGSGDVSLIASQSGTIKLTTGSTPQVTVQNNGSVDIATLSVGGLVKAATTTGRLSLATAGTDYENPLTFNNGLTRTVNTVRLGGTLTQATDIALGSNNFTFSGTGNVGVGTTNPAIKLQVAADNTIGNPASGIALSSLNQFAVSGATNQNKRFMMGFDTTNNYGIIGAGESGVAWYDLHLQPNNSTGIPNLTIKAAGNVGIGTINPGQKLTVGGTLGIIETGTSPTYHTIFQGGDQAADITYTLPTANVTNGFLTNNGSGTLSWTTTVPASSVPISSLTAATATNSINNADYTQTWNWNSLSGTGLALSSSSTAAAGNAQKLLSVAVSGANATSTQTTYGASFTNTHTGTSSTNVAGYFSASGGTNNYAAIFENGNVGIGTTTPSVKIDVVGTGTGNFAQYTNANDASNWGGVKYGWQNTDGSNAYSFTIGGYNASGNKLIRLALAGSPTGFSFSAGANDIFSFAERLQTNVGIIGQYHTDLDIVLNQHTNGGADKGIKFKYNGGSSTAMSIMETGNVGIGTTNPTSTLHTVASGAKTAAYTGNLLTNTATSTTGSITKTGLDVQSTGTWTGTGMVNVGLNVNATGGTTNYAALFNGGHVGIGTTSPSYALDVSTGGNISGRITSSSIAETQLYLQNTSTGGRLWSFVSGGQTPVVGVPTGNFGIRDGTSGLNRLTIDTSGSVTINALGTGVVKASSGTLSVGNVNLTSEVTGTLPVANGGTGQNWSSVATGALPYFSATGTMSTLGVGTSSQCLIGGTTPTWGPCSTGGGITGTGTTNRLTKFTGSTAVGDSSINDLNTGVAITIDATGQIGIGTTAPKTRLDVRSANAVVNTGAPYSGQAFFYTSDSSAIDKGGQIGFGGESGAAYSPYAFGTIAGRKETATSGDVSGYLQFSTTETSSTLSEKMRITAAGNVGIGTTNPLNKLSINTLTTANNLAQATIATNATTNKGLVIQGSASQTANLLEIEGSDGSDMVTFAPTATGAIGDRNIFTLGAGGGGTFTGVELQLNSANTFTSPRIQFVNGGGTPSPWYLSKGIAAGNNGSTADQFWITQDTTPRLIINSSGNVGIGTTTVGSKLQINGNAAIGYSASTAAASNGLLVAGNTSIGSTTTTSLFNVGSSAQFQVGSTGNATSTGYFSSSNTPWIGFDSASASLGSTASGGNIGYDGHLTLRSQGGGVAGIRFFTDGDTTNTRLVINNSGNVGIGTASPTSGLLQVTQPTAGTGTVTTNGTTTLTGSGTNFLNTFKVGDTITVSGETVRTISAIASNTSLTVSSAFSTSASTLAYTLTGGNRFVVQGNGNIGIGTTIPTAKLNVSGGTSGGILIDNFTAGQGLRITASSSLASGTPLLNVTNPLNTINYLTVGDTGNVIMNGGNVTIGSTTTTSLFNVGSSAQFQVGSTGNLSTSGTVTLSNANTSTSGALYSNSGVLMSEAQLATSRGGLGGNVTAAGAGAILYATGTTTYAPLAAGTSSQCLLGGTTPSWGACSTGGGVTGTGTPNRLAKFTSASAVGDSSINDLNTGVAVTIDSSGNVGINQTSPGAKLEAKADGTGTKGLIVKGNSSNDANIAEFQNNAGTALSYVNSSGHLIAPRVGFNSTTYMEPGSPGFRFYDTSEIARFSTAGLTLLSGSIAFPNGGGKISAGGAGTGASSRNMIINTTGTGVTATNAWSFSAYYPSDSYLDRVFAVRNDGRTLIGNNGGLSFPSAMLEVRPLNTTDVGIAVRGQASHTGNLFEAQNSGGTSLFTINSSGAIAAATGITSSGAINFSGLSTNGVVYTSGGTGTLNTEAQLATSRGGLGANVTAAGAGAILYATGTTAYAPLAAGTNTQCLLGGTTPSWGACSTGGGVTGTGTTNRLAKFTGSTAVGDSSINDLNTGVAMTIDSSARVGIGTTAPGNLLQVQGNSSGVNELLRLRNSNDTANSGASLAFTAYSGGDTTTGSITNLVAGGGYSLAFSTFPSAGPNTERMRITGTGDVGIGTTAPNNKLEISGGALSFYNPGNWTAVGFDYDATADSNNGQLRFRSNVGSSNLNTSHMVINRADGKVGIGDVSPASLFTVGNGDLFQVNSSGAIAAATGITSSGAVAFSGSNTSTTGALYSSSGTVMSEANLSVTRGGTGAGTFASNGVLYGNGTGAIQALAVNSTGTALCLQQVSSGAPTWGACSTGGVSSITGTANQITASASTGAVTLSIPSDFRAPGTVNAVSGLYTGAGAGTQRVDGSGNLVNIGTITSGLINGQTISSAANFTGSITAATNITATGNLYAGGGTSYFLNSVGTLQAQKFQDSSDVNFGLDPAGNAFSNYSLRTQDGAYIAAGGATAYGLLVGNGNVGIGTTTPGAKLEVYGGDFSVNNTNSGFGITSNYAGSGDIPAGTLIATGGTNSNLGIIPSGAGTAGSKVVGVAYNGTSWRSMLEYANVSSGEPNLLLVKNGGNVGIGVTSTSAKLDINAGSTQSALKINGTNNPEIILASSGTTRLELGVATSGGNYINGSSAGDVIFRQTSANKFLFSTSASGATNDLTLTGGNAGIGTSSPTSNTKLHVYQSGAINATNYGQKIDNLVTGSANGAIKYGTYITSTGAFTSTGITPTRNYGLYIDTISGGDNNYGAYISGNVGIGTATPGDKLHVDGGNIRINQSNGTNSMLDFYEAGTKRADVFWQAGNDYLYINSQNSPTVLNAAGGNVGIGTTSTSNFKLEMGGSIGPVADQTYDLGSSGLAWSTSYIKDMQGPSDIRKKKNIEALNYGLDDLMKLNPVSYQWRTGNQVVNLGLIAQEVQQVIPEIVHVGNDTERSLTISHLQLIPVTIRAIQEQEVEIRRMKNQNTSLATNLQAVYNASQINLTSTGDLHLDTKPVTKETVYNGSLTETIEGQNYTVLNAGQTVARISAYSSLVVGRIQTGLLKAGNVIVEGTLVASNATIKSISGVSAKFTDVTTKTLSANKVTSPIVETDKLVANKVTTQELTVEQRAQIAEIDANTIRPQGNDLTIDLSQQNPNGNKLKELVIKGLNNQKVAGIDAEGNATFSGTLTSSGVNTNTVTANEATLSGTLTAREIRADNIDALSNRTNELSTQNSALSTNVNDIQRLLEEIKNQPLPDAQYYQKLDPTKEYSISTQAANLSNTFTEMTGSNLTVTGQSTLYSVFVGGTLTAGTVSIENNQILALTSELKLSALSSINLLDGAVMVDRSGKITSRGAVVAMGGVETNEIRALNPKEDIGIKLGSETIAATATKPAQIRNSQFEIRNNQDKVVASVNASGSASFKDIAIEKYEAKLSAIIAADQNFQQNGIYAPAMKTNSEAAGTGILPAGKQELILYNQKVTDKSLIYVTATSPTQNKSLFVAGKKVGEYFKVAIDGTISNDVTFNWWIIN